MIGALTASGLMAVSAALVAAIPPQTSERPGEAESDRRSGRLPDEERTGPSDWLQKFPGPQRGFLIRLQSLCDDERYEGRLVSNDTQDEALQSERFAIGPAECTLSADGALSSIAIPVAFGDDRSRTWHVMRTDSGLALRHRHASAEGSDQPPERYGGVADGGGTFTRQVFTPDAETRQAFTADDRIASLENVWAVEIAPGDSFAYEMTRPGRTFRVEFDLATPARAD